MRYNFGDIPTYHKAMVNHITNYLPNEQDVDSLVEKILSSDTVKIRGAGRSGSLGKLLTYFLVKNGIDAHFMSDAGNPIKYEGNGMFIAITGSGNSPYVTIPLQTVGPPVFAITTNLNSDIAKISERTNGKAIEISAKNKEQNFETAKNRGEDSPILNLGTEFELDGLLLISDIVCKMATGGKLNESRRELAGYIKKYTPTSEEIETANMMLPPPFSNNKIVTIGNDGLSGMLCEFIGKRLGHCAKKEKAQERRVEYYKYAIPTKKSDVIFAISEAEERNEKTTDLATFLASKEREKTGAKVLAVCYDGSPLAKEADYSIRIPKPDNYLSSAYGHCLKEPAFAINSILASESLVHGILMNEELGENHLKENHSWLF